jgi:hypothetical protein
VRQRLLILLKQIGGHGGAHIAFVFLAWCLGVVGCGDETPSNLMPLEVIETAPIPIIISTSSPSVFPELLVASFQIEQKSKKNEVYELWILNSRTLEKRRIFTTTPGKQISTMMWGEANSDLLYVLEVKGTEEGYNAWQLYEVNYQSGTGKPFFDEYEAGFPRLLDISAQGKWIRILVEDLSSPGIGDLWFINTQDGSAIISEQFFFGFVWSPNDPDVFAYSQNASDTHYEKPQSVIIREVTNFEIIDKIDYEYTNWDAPSLVWHTLERDRILFFYFDEMYMVDLVEKSWTLVNQGFLFPQNGELRKAIHVSPSAKWLVFEYGGSGGVEVVNMSDIGKETFHFSDKIGQRYQFLSWYDGKDWIVIATEGGDVRVYELGGDFNLQRRINLAENGITAPEWYTTIVKPLD